MTGDRHPDGVARVRAPNPSPMTLDGTNTYVAAGWVIDPGPAHEGHLEAVLEAAGGRVGGIVVTHGHADHDEGAPALAERTGAPILRPEGDGPAGPFEAVATPGHSADHVTLLLGRICFTGDTVLGAGSVFIPPDGGSLSAYLRSLERLLALDLEVLCPGHGPYVWEPRAKLIEYREHRLERERRLLDALEGGLRSRDDLLDEVWADAPADLRPAAALTLETHLAKLSEEGRLPEGVGLAPDGGGAAGPA